MITQRCNYDWERLADGVRRCRLPFLDVTVGVVQGSGGMLLIDCGTTLAEARAIDSDVRTFDPRGVSHIVLTHNHFDHILGSSVFTDAAVSCAPEVVRSMVDGTERLRADAVRHGANEKDVDQAIAAWRSPEHQVRQAAVDLGARTALVSHPGRGHTNHDLIVAVPAASPDRGPTVVFCGDLVEESGDPAVDAESDPAEWPTTLAQVLAAGGPDAVFVPGHGAVVDSAFIRRQQAWLRGCYDNPTAFRL
jgi:glyoxylase-like metal-dependent hydrolase (beta-lactamase superfamily II)